MWIQLAEVGHFKGHAAGEFALTPATFSEICANFKRDKLPIPIDAEHASEQDPTSGTIPERGAPAMGWIHELDNRGEGGLWGCVEWLEPARSYIKEGRYKFISPAIRFNSRDRVTGQKIGARLTSAGITNSPFLRNMRPLIAASDRGAPSTSVTLSSYSTHEYMPRIKAALSMHPLASAAACKSCLSDLRDMVARGGAGTVDGVDLMNHLGPLRSLANLPAHATWPEIIDVIEALIDAAMDQHVEELHPEAESEEDEDEEDAAMSDQPAAGEQPIAANETQSAKGATETPTMSNPDEVTALSARVADLEKEKAGVNAKALRFEAENAALSTQLSDAEARIAKLEGENKTLRDTHAKWESQAAEHDVDEAIANAKGTKFEGVFCSDRRSTLVDWRKSQPAIFAASVPPRVDADKRHLMRDIATGPGRDAPQTQARETFPATVKRLMSEEKLSYEAAFNKANRLRKAV